MSETWAPPECPRCVKAGRTARLLFNSQMSRWECRVCAWCSRHVTTGRPPLLPPPQRANGVAAGSSVGVGGDRRATGALDGFNASAETVRRDTRSASATIAKSAK